MKETELFFINTKKRTHPASTTTITTTILHFNTQFLRYLHGSSLLNRSFSVPPSAATKAAWSPPPPPALALLLLVQQKAAPATTAISNQLQIRHTNSDCKRTWNTGTSSPSQTVGRFFSFSLCSNRFPMCSPWVFPIAPCFKFLLKVLPFSHISVYQLSSLYLGGSPN